MTLSCSFFVNKKGQALDQRTLTKIKLAYKKGQNLVENRKYKSMGVRPECESQKRFMFEKKNPSPYVI